MKACYWRSGSIAMITSRGHSESKIGMCVPGHNCFLYHNTSGWYASSTFHFPIFRCRIYSKALKVLLIYMLEVRNVKTRLSLRGDSSPVVLHISDRPKVGCAIASRIPVLCSYSQSITQLYFLSLKQCNLQGAFQLFSFLKIWVSGSYPQLHRP